MSLKQFGEFYWPALRKLMGILIENGFVPNLLLEGDLSSRLEIIKDVPPGTCICHFEHIDMEKAKKRARRPCLHARGACPSTS